MKPSKQLSDYWEKVLADEGMAEVCLFDNTGKGHAVRFISATLDLNSSPCADSNNEWLEEVNYSANGQVLRLEDTPTAVAARKLSHDVASLPPSWPSRELELLCAWAVSANFLDSCKATGITLAQGWKIRRRFEQFVRDSKQ